MLVGIFDFDECSSNCQRLAATVKVYYTVELLQQVPVHNQIKTRLAYENMESDRLP